MKRVSLTCALVAALAMSCGGSPLTGTSSSQGGAGGASSATGGTTVTSSSSDGGGGGGGAAPLCPTHEGTVLAVSRLVFGEGDNGQWKSVGFDIDGKETTALSKDVCQPYNGANPLDPYPDGDQGIDNSFGKNLLPTLLALYPQLSTDVNNGLKDGFFTAMLKIECLPPTGDAPLLTTKLFGGTKLGSKPKFDGTDVWPVEPELLSDPADPESSSIRFDKSSVTGTTFDSGNNVMVILAIPLATLEATMSIKLTLHAARVTMTLSEDRRSATGGMLGGVLNAEEFVAEVNKIGGLLEMCETPTLANLIDHVRQMSDILSDGSQDPSKTCDGISVGLGFEMKEVQLGGVGPATPPSVSCL